MKSNVQRFENAFNFVYRGVKSEPRPTYLFCHEELEIYCHYEGSAATLIEDAIYPLEDNSVVIIRPYVLHKTNIGAGAQELRTLLNVRRSLLDKYISNSRVSRVLDSFFAHNTAGGCIIRPSEPDLAAIERSFIAIHEAPQRQCADKYLLVALNIMQILVVLSEYLDQKSSQKAAQPAYNRIILRIMEEVNANLFEPFSMDRLAAHLGYNKHYLCHLFKQHTGATILNYAIARKITLAQHYILSGQYSVAEIAEMLAFSSSSHFASTFKAVTGLTPTQYGRREK